MLEQPTIRNSHAQEQTHSPEQLHTEFSDQVMPRNSPTIPRGGDGREADTATRHRRTQPNPANRLAVRRLQMNLQPRRRQARCPHLELRHGRRRHSRSTPSTRSGRLEPKAFSSGRHESNTHTHTHTVTAQILFSVKTTVEVPPTSYLPTASNPPQLEQSPQRITNNFSLS